jgi:hypothetical protein
LLTRSLAFVLCYVTSTDQKLARPLGGIPVCRSLTIGRGRIGGFGRRMAAAHALTRTQELSRHKLRLPSSSARLPHVATNESDARIVLYMVSNADCECAQ